MALKVNSKFLKETNTVNVNTSNKLKVNPKFTTNNSKNTIPMLPFTSKDGTLNPFELTRQIKNVYQDTKQENIKNQKNAITGGEQTAFVPRKLDIEGIENAQKDIDEQKRKEELAKNYLPQLGENITSGVATGLTNAYDYAKGTIRSLENQFNITKGLTKAMLGDMEGADKTWKEAQTKATENLEKDRQKTQWARDYQQQVLNENQEYSGLAKGLLNASNVASNMLGTSPAGTVGLFANAAGAGYNQALDEGASQGKALQYGTISGLAETGIESLSGGLSQKLLNVPSINKISKFTDNISNPLLRTGVNIIGDVVSEGGEEAISALLEPYIQKVTYNPNAGFTSWSEAMTDAGNAFVESILPTLLMGGTSYVVGRVNSFTNKQIEKIQSSNLSENEKQTLINQVQQEADKIIQNAKQNNVTQLPNIQQTIQTNEVISPVQEKRNMANVAQNNTNVQKNAQNQSSNEQISQNNVENSQNLSNTVQNTNNIEKNNSTIYNQTRGGKNEQIQREGMLGNNNEQTRIYENSQQEQINKYTREQYTKFEQSIKPIDSRKLSTNEQELIKEYNSKYNKEIVFFENGKNGYGGGASLVDNKKIYIDVNSAREFGYKRIATHEVMESDILHDNSVKNIIQPVINNIINDANFEQQKEEFWDGQDGDYPSDYLIAKDIICDKFAELENNEQSDYKNVLSEDVNKSIDNAIDKYKNIKNSTQGSFLMPSIDQLKARDIKQGEEISNNLNMKKPKIEQIAELTEQQAQLPTGSYKQNADKNTPYRRKFWDNVESSKIIGQNIKEKVTMTNYERKYNEEVLTQMKERLDADPTRLTQEWWAKNIKKATDQDIALGAILLERYQAEGRIEEAIDVVEKLADIGTEAGRTVQMYSIFQRLTPEGMQIYQQRKLNSALETLTKKQTGKWVEQNKDKFKLTEDDATFITAKVQEAQNAPTERQKQIALAEIEKHINDKLPPEAGQSVKAFRRIAMLFNPKTQVRNIVGNITVMPLNFVSDLVATAIDKAVAKKTNVRTTALPNVKTIGKGFKKGWNETWDDYQKGIRTTPTGTKYEIQNNVKSFNENTKSKSVNWINNKLNGIDRILSSVMEAGDRPFYEAAYQNALQGQMKANGVTEPTQEMIDIASNVALSQTWQDNNELTKAVLQMRSALNSFGHYIVPIDGLGLGDLIIPFAKTPANLAKAMIDYSPLAAFRTAAEYSDMKKAISRGDMTGEQQKKFVTSVGKIISGTLLYTLARGLVQNGAVTGSSDEDKDVANFEKNVLGIQPYSIKIGDKTYTYNWAQPLSGALATMADTKKMSEEGAEWYEILLNAFKVGGDQLVANSFLQGIQELLSSEYGNESAMDNLVGAIMDLPTQFTPTLFGQIATQFDSTKRQTFENGDTVGTMWNEVKNKLPGVRNTLAPQVNTFGEEIQNYGGDNNPFNVFLNPGNISSTNATETQKELYKLYQDTKDKTIFPAQAPYSISGGGEKVTLSSQDRADYQKRSGQFVSENLEALFDSEYYKTLDNDKKAEVVNEIVTDANTLAKGEYLETKASKELKEKLTKLGDIPYVEYYNAWSATRGIESDKNWKGESISGSKKKKQIQAINNATSKNLTNKQRETLYGLLNVSGY